MPSSGSTTSRMASSTSATFGIAVSWVVMVSGLRVDRAGVEGGRVDPCLVQRVRERHPSQQSTLHACGVLRDAGKRDAVADDLFVAGVLTLGGEHGAHGCVG